VFKVPEITLEKYFLKKKWRDIFLLIPLWWQDRYKLCTFINHCNAVSIVIRKRPCIEKHTLVNQCTCQWHQSFPSVASPRCYTQEWG
jgi:hypothetical protein